MVLLNSVIILTGCQRVTVGIMVQICDYYVHIKLTVLMSRGAVTASLKYEVFLH